MKKLMKQSGKLSLNKVQVTRLHNMRSIKGGSVDPFNGFNHIGLDDDNDDDGSIPTWSDTVDNNNG